MEQDAFPLVLNSSRVRMFLKQNHFLVPGTIAVAVVLTATAISVGVFLLLGAL